MPHVNFLIDAINCKSHLDAIGAAMIIVEMSAEKYVSKLNIEVIRAENWLSDNKVENVVLTILMILSYDN